MSSTPAETLDWLMQERRSIRGFLPDPVPESLLRTILRTAQFAPSNCNVQPWQVHLVSGDAAEGMRAALHERAVSGARPVLDFPRSDNYSGLWRSRQIAAAVALFQATGVARDDKPARAESFLRNFRFFDAPHAIFIFIPEWAGMREAADVGMYAQSLMLALTAHGLASCAQGALSHQADIVHERLGVGPEFKLLFGLAIGYPDPDHPANAARTARADLAEAVTFHH